MAEIIYREESYEIIGACFEVYKQKGCGFTEPVYQECLALEFGLREIPFVAQPKVEMEYNGVRLEQFFRLDFVCFDKIVIELKAQAKLIDENRSQTLNYLHANKFKLALLVNFGSHPKLEYERLVL